MTDPFAPSGLAPPGTLAEALRAALVRVTKILSRHRLFLGDLEPYERELAAVLAVTLLLVTESPWCSSEDAPGSHHHEALLEAREAVGAEPPAIELAMLCHRRPRGLVTELADELLVALANGVPVRICRGAAWVAAAELGGLLKLRGSMAKRRCGGANDA